MKKDTIKVAYISDDIYLHHDTGSMHPESAQRLKAINASVASLKDSLFYIDPIEVSSNILTLVHTEEHVANMVNAYKNKNVFNSDMVYSSQSYEAASVAVGAGIVAIDGIKNGKIDRAFCAVRPPGHHATPTQAMGFCIFNNIAISARYAQSVGYKKVMIIDFDVHHGNGTQDTFYEDDTVFYFSSHQSHTYPGTGAESEIGVGKGKGYTANFLLSANSRDDVLLDIYKNKLPHIIDTFNPDIILVSAGYDLHESDPLAQLNISTEGIRKMVRMILDSKDVPFVFFLEGGYDVQALANNVKVTLEEMLV